MLGVTALGRFASQAIPAAVGAGIAFAAQLFLTLAALIALLAAIDHAAHRDGIADLVAGHGSTDRSHPTDDFMARDDGVRGPAPVVAGGMQVGVADAAVENLHGNIIVP